MQRLYVASFGRMGENLTSRNAVAEEASSPINNVIHPKRARCGRALSLERQERELHEISPWEHFQSI